MGKIKVVKTDHIGDMTIHLTQGDDGLLKAANYSAVIINKNGEESHPIIGEFSNELSSIDKAAIEVALTQIRRKIALILPPY